MTSSRNGSRWITMILGFCWASVAAGQDGVRENLDDYLERVASHGFAGNVLIARDGEILLSKGYGLANRETGAPMTPATVISMGSISKHFTAAAILRLEMDDLLSVEDSVELFFDDVPDDKRDITIHHLLTHQSGFPESSGVGSADRDAFVRQLMQTRLVFPPGQGASYSNLGYSLLAAIVEVVSETPFEEFLQDEILGPAGMEQTGHRSPTFRTSDVGQGYVDGQSIGSILDQEATWPLIGSGGLLTCPSDMWSWNQALDEGTVLSPDSVGKMTTIHLSRGRAGFGIGYGCGIDQTARGTRRIGHNGSNDVFSADFRRFPDEDAFLYAAGTDADVYSFDLTPALEAILFGAEVEGPPAVVDLGEEAWQGIVGRYRLASGGDVVARRVGDRLDLMSDDVVGAGLLFPVPEGQVRRREALLRDLPEAFEKAHGGEFDALHQMLDPFMPAAEFESSQARQLAGNEQTYGPFQNAQAIPGRNRFGEIAILAILHYESRTLRIEFSFGDREVGSIRFVDGPATRTVRPVGEGRFAAFVAESGELWQVECIETSEGKALRFAGGEEATRVDDQVRVRRPSPPAGSAAGADPFGGSPWTWDTLAERMQEAEASGFAGSVVVVRGGEVVLHEGYGVAQRPDTIYAIGSTPIDFTHVGILLLEQEGKLRLDKKITAFFDDVPDDKRDITLNHLRSGQSGLPDFHDLPTDRDPDHSYIDRDEAIRRIMNQKLLFAPGMDERHSHSAWGVLAAVIEVVSGMTYPEFTCERLFEPAGMVDTGFFGEDYDEDRMAIGHGSKRDGEINAPPYWGPTSWLVMGSGGQVSTVGDLMRWIRTLRAGDILDRQHQQMYFPPAGELCVGGDMYGFGAIYTQGPDSWFVLLSNAAPLDQQAPWWKVAEKLNQLTAPVPR